MNIECCAGLIFVSALVFAFGINFVLCEKSKFTKALGIVLISISIIAVIVLLTFFMNHIPGTLSASLY